MAHFLLPLCARLRPSFNCYMLAVQAALAQDPAQLSLGNKVHITYCSS